MGPIAPKYSLYLSIRTDCLLQHNPILDHRVNQVARIRPSGVPLHITERLCRGRPQRQRVAQDAVLGYQDERLHVRQAEKGLQREQRDAVFRIEVLSEIEIMGVSWVNIIKTRGRIKRTTLLKSEWTLVKR